MNNKIIISATLLFINIFPIFARDIIILVEDEDMIPLERAVVSLSDGKQFICDNEGRAQVILPDNMRTVVSITYQGYETLWLTIPAVTAASSKQLTASLQPIKLTVVGRLLSSIFITFLFIPVLYSLFNEGSRKKQ
jgi:hypothetical protein